MKYLKTKIINSFWVRFFIGLVLIILPYSLLELIQTEVNVTYAWWENILGYTSVTLLSLGYGYAVYALMFELFPLKKIK